MPIVTIESQRPAKPSAITQMQQEIQQEGAKAFNCPASNFWVVFRPVEIGHYVHFDHLEMQTATKMPPPIVIIKAQRGRTAALKEALVRAVAAAVGRALDTPTDNVWVHYQELEPRDVWFDGRWAASDQESL